MSSLELYCGTSVLVQTNAEGPAIRVSLGIITHIIDSVGGFCCQLHVLGVVIKRRPCTAATSVDILSTKRSGGIHEFDIV